MAKTFRKGGVHPPEEKLLTRDCPIESMPLPSRLVVPVIQSAGAPAEPVVKARDEVRTGQIIAKAAGNVSANVHAPASGIVKSVGPFRTTVGQAVTCVEIESDG